jgi:hypothetical protein
MVMGHRMVRVRAVKVRGRYVDKVKRYQAGKFHPQLNPYLKQKLNHQHQHLLWLLSVLLILLLLLLF